MTRQTFQKVLKKFDEQQKQLALRKQRIAEQKAAEETLENMISKFDFIGDIKDP